MSEDIFNKVESRGWGKAAWQGSGVASSRWKPCMFPILQYAGPPSTTKTYSVQNISSGEAKPDR